MSKLGKNVYLCRDDVKKICEFLKEHPEYSFTSLVRVAVNQFIDFYSPRLYPMKLKSLEEGIEARATEGIWLADE
jgi:hypothetical protein